MYRRFAPDATPFAVLGLNVPGVIETGGTGMPVRAASDEEGGMLWFLHSGHSCPAAVTALIKHFIPQTGRLGARASRNMTGQADRLAGPIEIANDQPMRHVLVNTAASRSSQFAMQRRQSICYCRVEGKGPTCKLNCE